MLGSAHGIQKRDLAHPRGRVTAGVANRPGFAGAFHSSEGGAAMSKTTNKYAPEPARAARSELEGKLDHGLTARHGGGLRRRLAPPPE